MITLLASLALAQDTPEPSPALETSAPPAQAPILPPKLLQDVTPAYPEEARARAVSGDVLVMLTVDSYGNVVAVELLAHIHLAALRAHLEVGLRGQGAPRARCERVLRRADLDAQRVCGGA